MKDDLTGEPLIRRSDDNAEDLKTRLASYHSKTSPLIDYYQRTGIHFRVDAAQKSDKVFSDILTAFENARRKNFSSSTNPSQHLRMAERQ